MSFNGTAIQRGNVPLGMVILFSVIFRLISAMLQGDSVQPLPGVHDQLSYDALAQRVVAGYGFSFGVDWWPATKAGQPTAFWSYLYTLYLTAIYQLCGHHPLAARLLQALFVGILQPWLTWRIGARLFGVRTATIAAIWSAVYGYFVYYAGSLITESFYILSVLWVIDVSTRMAMTSSSPQLRMWLELGCAVAAASLLRQAFFLFIPVLLVWLLWRAKGTGELNWGWHPALVGLSVFLFTLALLIAPWSLRNLRAFNRFVLLNTNAGISFYWANHHIHGTSFTPVLPEYGTSYRNLIPPGFRQLDEAQLDRQLLRSAIVDIVEDPGRYVLLSLSRVEEFFKFWPSSHSSLLGNIVRTLSFGILLPLTIVGLCQSSLLLWREVRITSFDSSRHMTPTTISKCLPLAFCVTYTAIHVLTWTLVRYRVPIDSVLVLYASQGLLLIAGTLPRFRRVDAELVV
jgi:4-amino-4-deoxy-L-arabinose transferase-like glycosyltransferase